MKQELLPKVGYLPFREQLMPSEKSPPGNTNMCVKDECIYYKGKHKTTQFHIFLENFPEYAKLRYKAAPLVAVPRMLHFMARENPKHQIRCKLC